MRDSNLKIIGGLINNAYGRARRAFETRDLKGYQELALLQANLGAHYLDLNVDRTPRIQVTLAEMLAFLPEVIPAIQEATSAPICFDSPSMEYQKVCLKHYDRNKGGRPIVNSIAASREHLDEMIELVGEYDTLVIVMVSEMFTSEGSAQCLDPNDSLRATKDFVERLTTKANRTLDHILIDPGLAPVGADTYGLVNIGLDTMRLIHDDPDLQGIHMHVGLTNFAWGTPMNIRPELEKAYLALAMPLGLDYALANPEIDPRPLPAEDPLVGHLRDALEQGRASDGESRETAGFRQAEAIMEICRAAEPDDD